MTLAFHDDPALRLRLIEQVGNAIAAQQFLPDDDTAIGDAMSLVALLGDDPAGFEETTGIPASVGLLGDSLLRSLVGPDRDRARDLARTWIAAPAPGADMTARAAALALWILDAAGASADNAAFAAVRALHEEAVQGRMPARRQWAEARGAALAAADTANDDETRVIAELAASIAWPADRSRTVLVEAMTQLGLVEAGRAGAALGWTDAMNRACDETMQKLWDDTAAVRDADPAAYDFQQHFHLAFPDLAKRKTTAYQAQQRAWHAFAEETSDALPKVLRDGVQADAPRVARTA